LYGWELIQNGVVVSYSKTLKIVMIVCGLLASAWLSNAAIAQDLNDLKAGVVKITTKTGQVGTGFIVRLESDVVYIITAAHVIVGDNQPEVEFFTKRNVPVKGAVLPGAEVNDDLRGLALVVVREKANIPAGVMALAFGVSADLVSGGEDALVIGHSGGGGNWALAKRLISNRQGRDISLDPGVASRFSGGPIIVDDKVVGIVMSNRDGFGLGITHKSVLNYMEGFGVVPSPFPIVDETKSSSIPKLSALTAIPTPPSASSSQTLPQTKIAKDGAPMVLVPAGEFTMGVQDGYDLRAHEVFLNAFYIDQYEVTVQRYQRFLTQKNQVNPDYWKQPDYWEQVDLVRDAQKPVVGINWHDAKAYCEWVDNRLPTEAEWEKTARGPDRWTYPWGNAKPDSSRANFGKSGDKDKSEGVYVEKLKAVGSYERGKSPYGAYDMVGNVLEWVADWYRREYYRSSPKENPKGPSFGDGSVLRGGSWKDDKPKWLRSAVRVWSPQGGRSAYIGFRCAQDAR